MYWNGFSGMEAKQVESLVLTISTTMPNLPSDLTISRGKIGRAKCARCET